MGYHCSTDSRQLLTCVYVTFIWRWLSFPSKPACFQVVFSSGRYSPFFSDWGSWRKSSASQRAKTQVCILLQVWQATRASELGSCSCREPATAGMEHSLQQQQVTSYCLHQLYYLQYLAIHWAKVVTGHWPKTFNMRRVISRDHSPNFQSASILLKIPFLTSPSPRSSFLSWETPEVLHPTSPFPSLPFVTPVWGCRMVQRVASVAIKYK